MPDPLLALSLGLLIFAGIAWFLWPEKGLLWRWQRSSALTQRVLREDALKHLHQCELHGQKPTHKSLAGALNVSLNQVAEILHDLEAHQLLEYDGPDFRLAAGGRDYALRIIRAHRLWEKYLADETGYAEADWHDQADRYEHRLTPAELDALAARLGHPTHDPHGDPIPTASGQLVYRARTPLPQMALDRPARIIHIEDEPEAIYAQLVAEGLHVGMTLRVMEVSPQRIRFWAGGDEHVLAPILAANIAVCPLAEEEAELEEPGLALTQLKVGQAAQVQAISQRIRGAERRRLMDLGILPGTPIEVEMHSPGGDPTAYRVRGAVIALRASQAENIRISQIVEEAV
ncbi:MAG: metal-dependent transcriptional regulator [Anaerolineales bacterium]|nr:metal-dependent transcriptional regulator [Anaerolineales bacterium]